MSKRGKRETEICDECGAEFRKGRLACPECGSDAQTGWKDEEEIQYESIEIPDGWGPENEPSKGPGRYLLIAAVLAILGMLVFALSR